MTDADLSRFVTAQNRHWDAILAELRAAQKATHWMWYVFPQLRGLGRSERAMHYGLADRAEAAAYHAHPVLGPRLAAVPDLLLAAGTDDPVAIFGPVDAQKLRSSMTLFDAIAPEPRFAAVLDRFYGGTRCERTLDRLAR